MEVWGHLFDVTRRVLRPTPVSIYLKPLISTLISEYYNGIILLLFRRRTEGFFEGSIRVS